MSKHRNPIDKIIITFANGAVTTVTPESGHSVILSLDSGDHIDQVVTGKVSELCGLLDSIHAHNPEILAIVTAARITKRGQKLNIISDEAFRDTPTGGTA